MSRVPYTKLTVNPDAVDIVRTGSPDIIYMMAPALKGPTDITLIGSMTRMEETFGKAGLAGNFASQYAQLIYDYGRMAVKVKRLGTNLDVLDNLVINTGTGDPYTNAEGEYTEADSVTVLDGFRSAFYVLSDKNGTEVMKFVANSPGSWGNNLNMELERGSEEGFMLTLNGWGESILEEGGADIPGSVKWDNLLTLADIASVVNGTLVKVNKTGSAGVYYGSPTDDTTDAELAAGKAVPGSNYMTAEVYDGFEGLTPDDIFSSDTGQPGVAALTIEVNDDGDPNTYSISVDDGVVTIDNGVGDVISTTAVTLTGVVNEINDSTEEPFQSLTAYIPAYTDGDRLASVLMNVPSASPVTVKADAGTAYLESVSLADQIIPFGMTLGKDDITPAVLDYSEALKEAEFERDITIVLAPGASDWGVHMLMNQHCVKMDNIGLYRNAFAGVGLNETLTERKSRTDGGTVGGLAVSGFDSRRLWYMGEGGYIIDQVTGSRKLVSGATLTAAMCGKLVSQDYWISLTYKYLTNVLAAEGKRDLAWQESLHESRLIGLQVDNGLQIVDGISTSTKNAFEDINVVRIIDTVSRAVNEAMKKAIGRGNVPNTWSFVVGLIYKALETLNSVGAIASNFEVINEVSPTDIVSKRFPLRVKIAPVFPIKYVETEIDIIPPAF